jgi:hypothetical protein
VPSDHDHHASRRWYSPTLPKILLSDPVIRFLPSSRYSFLVSMPTTCTGGIPCLPATMHINGRPSPHLVARLRRSLGDAVAHQAQPHHPHLDKRRTCYSLERPWRVRSK